MSIFSGRVHLHVEDVQGNGRAPQPDAAALGRCRDVVRQNRAPVWRIYAMNACVPIMAGASPRLIPQPTHPPDAGATPEKSTSNVLFCGSSVHARLALCTDNASHIEKSLLALLMVLLLLLIC